MGSKTVNIANVPYIGGRAQLSEAETTLYVNKYIANLKVAGEDQPFHNNILGFLKLVQNAVRSREAVDNVPEDKRLLVLGNDPPESIDTEAITFFLKSRSPGQFNRGRAGEARIKEVIGHIRNIEPHPEHIGEKLVTMGRLYDNRVAFNIYAKDDYTALARVLWFENVMDSFRWYFRVHGISQVIEEGVGDKENVTIGELPLTKYPMSYFIRTEDIYQFGSQELKNVELNVKLETNN